MKPMTTSRRKVILITTGGTIAGAGTHSGDASAYTAGRLGADVLLAALGDSRAHLPDIELVELFSIDSKDMTPSHWIQLARRIQSALEQDDCDGVVVTHGTDTLEEAAWFLHLVLPVGAPVVLTAAMRPATALSSDGPMNLYQALQVAAHPDARDHGVLVVVNDRIFAAADVTKTHTRQVDAIQAPGAGPIGDASTIKFHHARSLDSAGICPIARLAQVAPLPRVDILYVAAGSEPDVLAQAASRGCAGVVLALPGNGSLPADWRPSVDVVLGQGLRVVRSSRTGAGDVTRSTAGSEQVLESAGALSPAKARISLMLSLATGPHDRNALPGA